MLGFAELYKSSQADHELAPQLELFLQMMSPPHAGSHDMIMQVAARLQPIPPDLAGLLAQRIAARQPPSAPDPGMLVPLLL